MYLYKQQIIASSAKMSIKPTPPKPSQYFEEKKKGEMNELKNALNNVINDNDNKKGREVIKKVISYMTLGMDASPVFSEMCRASFTNDEVMKKMIYFYLTTYAEDNSDLAIMAVNTFKKDCKHTSSKIRGLALRNLCSFKSADYVNNSLPMIRQLLTDFQPYVKKTAIMGLLKMFYAQPQTILHDESLINCLSQLIKDSDSLVSINALLALDQILISEGGIPLNGKLYRYLIHRLRQYNQWQQTCVLDILYRYNLDKENDKQRYEILSILWDKLKHSSTPLVLASIKIILKYTEKRQQLFKNIVEKIKAPLITLMTGNQNSGSYETMYVVLQHIEYVVLQMRGKQFFEKDFKYFYCKADEPTYIKSLKVKILGELANEYNLGDLLNELNDYATDVDIQMARKAIKTLTQIALNLPQVSKPLLININSYYKLGQNHLANEVMLSFHQILRKYPKLFPEISKTLIEYRNDINQTEAIKSFIWILGNFTQYIDQSPYILEEFIQNQELFHSYDNGIKQVLLTSIVQTFLRRPLETYNILNSIFKLIFTSDTSSVVLVDHASFYYTALYDSPEEVKKSFNSFEQQMTKFRQQLPDSVLDQDFNSLSIIFKQKQAKYIKPFEYFVSMRNKELGLVEPEGEQEQEEEDQGDVIGNNENVGEGGQEEELGDIQAEHLDGQLVLDSEQFETIYNQLEESVTAQLTIQNEQNIAQQSIEQLFKMWSIPTMASSEQQEGQTLKFYFYAKDTRNNCFYIVEMHFDKANQKINMEVKAKKELDAQRLKKYVMQLLSANELIQETV